MESLSACDKVFRGVGHSRQTGDFLLQCARLAASPVWLLYVSVCTMESILDGFSILVRCVSK